VLFFNGVLIRHPIFWETRHFENPNETKKVKEKTLAKDKDKRND
jgi:hypothetical protein